MELKSPDYKELKIPIGIRKKLDKIKRNMVDFIEPALQQPDQTTPQTTPAAQDFQQPSTSTEVIQYIEILAQPGNYPAVSIFLNTKLNNT